MMDLAQALLCLVSFGKPQMASADPSVKSVCENHNQYDDQRKPVDLDYHLQRVELDGKAPVMDAGYGFNGH